MGPLGPMMTRTWFRIQRDVLREAPPGLGGRDDTVARNVGASVNMMDEPPALWEDDEETPDLKSVMGV